MSDLILTAINPVTPAQADDDLHLVELWIRRHESSHTQRNYRRIAGEFMAFVGRPLAAARLGDIQAFVSTLEGKAPATRALHIAAIKSLFAFALQTGFLSFNPAAVVKAGAVKNRLAERIMSEADALALIHGERNRRNRVLIRLLYAAGLRVSEACRLSWADVAPTDAGAQITVFGKGGKTRVVLLSQATGGELLALRGNALDADPVFRSRKGGALVPSQVHRVLKQACARAGLPAAVSCHWLRHAHASHALDRGAPVHLVQATLGHASVATTGRYLHARPNDSSARHLAV
jgi:site-specific recombinase XerD